MLPLERYRMLDLSRLMPGPMASHILADMGMDVIKVEETEPRYGQGRDVLTEPDPTPENEVKWAAYNSLARNKKSIALNLLDPNKRPRSQEVFHKLARKADVILEGYRPGVAKWMGVDYEAVRAYNPRIIYCSLSGWGPSGPYHKVGAHGNMYSGVAGTLEFADGKPVGQGVAPPTYSPGIYAAIGILGALLERERSGEGQQIDIPMVGAIMSFNLTSSASYFREHAGEHASQHAGAQPAEPRGPSLAYLKCKDGKYISTGNSETYFWENFCKVLGREDYLPLRRASGPEARRMVEDIQELFLTKTREEWLEILWKADTAAAPVNTMIEAFEDPQIRHLGMVWETKHPTEGLVKQMGFPFRFSRTPASFRNFAPLLGEHTRELLREAGYTPEQIVELERTKIVKSWAGS